MIRSESYKTKQKDMILDVIKKQTHEFTVKDIYQEMKEKIGLTTIYRLVDKLVHDGILSKTVGKDNSTYYQYLESCNHENHFYLKCEVCGSLTHVDCDCIKDLSNHIFEHHQFITNREHIIINGICAYCNSNRQDMEDRI